jgi:Fur family transcriptional regulator, stress-responsive regulator
MADYPQQLRAADLRVTRSRIAVFQAVCAHPHSDAETIFEAVRDALPEVCRQTVYDVLHALTDVRMLRRVHLPGYASRYECRFGDNHHHSVCRSCGAIADVECAVDGAPCLLASHHNGFHLEEAEVIYWGLCSDCVPSPVRPVGTVAGNGGFVIRPGLTQR